MILTQERVWGGIIRFTHLMVSQNSDCSDIHPRVNDELFKFRKLGGVVVPNELLKISPSCKS